MRSWKERFENILEDPLLNDVRPFPKPITAEDRLIESIKELLQWIEQNNKVPSSSSFVFEEKRMAKRLEALLEDADKKMVLLSHDIDNVLGLA